MYAPDVVTDHPTVFFTTKEVADMLKVSKRTVERLKNTGELGWYRVGGSTRIAPAHLQAYLDGNFVEQSTAPAPRSDSLAPTTLSQARHQRRSI